MAYGPLSWAPGLGAEEDGHGATRDGVATGDGVRRGGWRRQRDGAGRANSCTTNERGVWRQVRPSMSIIENGMFFSLHL